MNITRGFYTLTLSALMASLALLSGGCGKQDATKATESVKQDSSAANTPVEQDLKADTVIAKVNGREISFSELQSKMEKLILSLPQKPPADVLQHEIPTILNQVLNNTITLELIDKAVKDEGVTVPDSDVVKKLRQIAARLPKDKLLSEMLAEQGSSLQQFRANLKRELALQKLMDEHTANITTPTPEQVDDFYKANTEKFKVPAMAKVHQILIPFRPDDSDEVKQEKLGQLKDIRKRIIEGTDFAEMAREHSSGPSAKDGGDLGYLPRGQMPKSFDDAVFSQTIGEVGEPIETTYGCHLIRVDDRQPAHTVPLDEAHPNIEQFLLTQAKQAAWVAYMKQLRDQSSIEIMRDMSKISVKFNPDIPQEPNSGSNASTQ